MPWEVVKTKACPPSKPWAVVKATGNRGLVACHETEADAKQQMAALYANEPTAGQAPADRPGG